MREPATLTRRAAAALPLAALLRPVAAALPAEIAGAGDATLLSLGRRWEAALQAERAHSATFSVEMCVDEALKHEAVGGALFETSSALLEQIILARADTPAGLAVKARVLAYESEAVDDPDEGSILAALVSAHFLLDRAALSLAIDCLRLARAAS